MQSKSPVYTYLQHLFFCPSSHAATLRRAPGNLIRNIAHLHHNTHPNSLMPQDMAMHQPQARVIQLDAHDNIALRTDVHRVFAQGRLCVEELGCGGELRCFKRVIRLAEFGLLLGRNDVEFMTMLPILY